jgi:hypothetical protein
MIFHETEFPEKLENLILIHERVKNKLKHLELVSVINHNHADVNNVLRSFMPIE